VSPAACAWLLLHRRRTRQHRQPRAPGQVYDSNRYTLHGVLTRLGCDLMDMGVIPDCPEAIEAAFCSAAASSDVILSSGGVSVGDADFIRTLMDSSAR
jgi:molybdopterin molybdotransferase